MDSWEEFSNYIDKIIGEGVSARIGYEEYKLARKIINTVTDIAEWGEEKGIDNPEKQFQKLSEEMLEAHEAYLASEYYRPSETEYDHLVEELGDIGIVWLLLCNMLEVSPLEALQKAHNKNKDRKGKTINGNFIKEEDLN